MKTSPTHSRSRLAALALLTLSAASSLLAQPPEILGGVPSRDPKVIRRWALPGDPHGIAIGAGGTIYVGLAQPQAVVAIDPKTGAVRKRVVLDSAEIASTKELLTLRTNSDRSLLFIANGSDESATILSLPDLAVVREITMEGEPIRDAVPDPRGRFVYLLGRRVHVFDRRGETELHTLDVEDPKAIAVSSSGRTLAVVGSEIVLFDTSDFHEVARKPLRSVAPVESALFAAGDEALVILTHSSLAEIVKNTTRSDRVCLPEGSGPQIATLAASDLLLFAEQRCNSSAPFAAAARRVTPVSLYGVNAYALAYDREANTLVTTDRSGYLTIFKVPHRPVVH